MLITGNTIQTFIMPATNPLQKKIILASASPRRLTLIKELGIDYTIVHPKINEIFPADLSGKDIAKHLAKLKADYFEAEKIPDDQILITADTVVCLGNKVLNKPKDYEDARQMLETLSGHWHEVITAVCLKSKHKEKIFSSSTKVLFKKLTTTEIDYYIHTYQPFDKAGAYGIQEWIGFVGIKKISGSFYNVMGLPVQKLYEELQKF